MGWIILTFILGIALAWFIFWMRNNNFSLRWYEWLVGVIGIVFILAGGQHLFGSFREDYAQAGWLGAAVFGIIGLIFLAISWQLAARRSRS
jgi:hypothetical protein